MHAGTKELIDLRDGAPVAARVIRHSAECERCSTAVTHLAQMQLQLRQLAGFQPPQRAWLAIEQRLQQPQPMPARAVGAGLAATLIGAALLSMLLWSSGQWRTPQSAGSGEAPAVDTVPLLVARSQQIEALLRGLPRPAVERAATSAAIDELQTRIQVLDVQLSSAQEAGLDRTEAQQLWTTRVQLLNSLLSVRYAEQAAHGDYLPVSATGDI